jgi:hypothetical protein
LPSHHAAVRDRPPVDALHGENRVVADVDQGDKDNRRGTWWHRLEAEETSVNFLLQASAAQ